MYISTDSSDPGVSAIEGNTFAPLLGQLEIGIDDIERSAVERIFIAVNGASDDGCDNPQRQGLVAALLDGHRPNNTFGGIPTIAGDYSPVWDANQYEWTHDAIQRGYRGLLTEEFRILLHAYAAVTGLAVAPLLTPERLRSGLAELLELARRGELPVVTGGTNPIERPGDARRALESRVTTGKIVPLP